MLNMRQERGLMKSIFLFSAFLSGEFRALVRSGEMHGSVLFAKLHNTFLFSVCPGECRTVVEDVNWPVVYGTVADRCCPDGEECHQCAPLDPKSAGAPCMSVKAGPYDTVSTACQHSIARWRVWEFGPRHIASQDGTGPDVAAWQTGKLSQDRAEGGLACNFNGRSCLRLPCPVLNSTVSRPLPHNQ